MKTLKMILSGREAARQFKCIFIILLLFNTLLMAQDEFDFNEQNSFDFNEIEESGKMNLPISGRLNLESAWQLSNPDRWILLGPSLNLILDHNSRFGQVYFEGIQRYNLSYQIEEDPATTRDDYELEFIFRELFWKRAFDDFTFSAGRIIDVRGVMDLLQIADKVPAINRANYFFADPEEVKLGQNMIKMEYFTDQMDAGLLFIPYPNVDRITDSDHPYAMIRNRKLYDKNEDRQVEGSAYLNRYFSKGLISFYAGRFNNRTPIIEALAQQPAQPIFYTDYQPYWSLGGASNLAIEPFLIKFETVFNFNKPLQTTSNNLPAGFLKRDELEMALGLDYNHGDGGLYTLEVSATRPMQKNDLLAMNRTVWYGAFSASNNFFNDRLKMNFVTFFTESMKNMINRFQVEYYLTNTLSVSAKYTRFAIHEKKEDYGFMEDYDRIDFGIHYDF